MPKIAEKYTIILPIATSENKNDLIENILEGLKERYLKDESKNSISKTK